jgi:hypothetical protein
MSRKVCLEIRLFFFVCADVPAPPGAGGGVGPSQRDSLVSTRDSFVMGGGGGSAMMMNNNMGMSNFQNNMNMNNMMMMTMGNNLVMSNNNLQNNMNNNMMMNNFNNNGNFNMMNNNNMNMNMMRQSSFDPSMSARQSFQSFDPSMSARQSFQSFDQGMMSARQSFVTSQPSSPAFDPRMSSRSSFANNNQFNSMNINQFRQQDNNQGQIKKLSLLFHQQEFLTCFVFFFFFFFFCLQVNIKHWALRFEQLKTTTTLLARNKSAFRLFRKRICNVHIHIRSNVFVCGA